MATSQALPGSAFHPSWTTRGGHRRLRPLSAVEAREPIGVTILVREDSPIGADACARVGAWVRRAKVGPTAVDPVTGRVQVSGPTVDLARLFGVELERFSWDRDGGVVEYRGHRGPVMVPAEIAGLIVGVYGLDDRPVARSHVRTLDEAALLAAYNPAEVAALYAYPRLPRSDAPRELTAAMIELGGVTHQRDVELSFARLGLPPPRIENVWLDGAMPLADPEGADLEVALDYQVLGGMVLACAPDADLTIVTYNAPNSERGFIDAVATVAADTRRRPAAASISWGAPEDHWSLQGLLGLDAAFAAGARRGVTYSAAAGDAGSSNAETDGRQHAEFPASSPHVWACGGTTLLAADGRIVREQVWNELAAGAGVAGSGVSGVFNVPLYQQLAGLLPRNADSRALGRGLPDGSGNADPRTGWNVVSDARLRVTGGTSAVAPMYTALWTLVAAQQQRRLGLPHPALYRARGRGFNDVTRGDTGGPYSARTGWDPASGWGSPNGTLVARELQLAMRSRAAPVRELG